MAKQSRQAMDEEKAGTTFVVPDGWRIHALERARSGRMVFRSEMQNGKWVVPGLDGAASNFFGSVAEAVEYAEAEAVEYAEGKPHGEAE